MTPNAEAAKVLIEVAKKAKEEALEEYSKKLAELEKFKQTATTHYYKQMEVATDLCDHSGETVEKDEIDYHDHGRTEYHYTAIHCAVCGKHLRRK